MPDAAPAAAEPHEGFRIAEVARRTGFTPSALRYYEKAGVLAPPDRTPSGYRTYDRRAIDRLRLVARAKDLGCSLEEIRELVEAWDADECAPVQHRLRSSVLARIAEVQHRIAEQVAFAAELQATASALAERSVVDGPCDDRCGCNVAVTLVAAGDAPIACSLADEAVSTRVQEWHAVLGGVQRRDAIAGGMRLQLATDADLAEISRLAAAEHACCGFFAFALTVDRRGPALEVTAPADAQDVLTALFGAVA